MDNKKFLTKSAEETIKLAYGLAGQLTGKVVCLYGQLGSGKTTFAQGIGKGLGIKKLISSPTFVFIKEYPFSKKPLGQIEKFYHIDFYRLKQLSGAESLGIKEILSLKSGIVVIEWPEVIEKILPGTAVKIYFDIEKKDNRSIEIKP